MKKFLSIALFLSLIFTMSTTAFAAPSESSAPSHQVSGISVASSISNEQIDNLPHAIKDRLQEIDATLVSVSTEYFDLDPNTGVVTRSTMPEADFEITVTASQLSKSEKRYDNLNESDDAYEFMAVGRWYVNPNFEFTDCIGITWSDEFTLYKDEGYTYSYGKGYKRYSTMTLNDVSPEQGFAYDADLQLLDRQDEIVIMGRVYKANSSGSANVCASYGHVIITASSVDVSFSSGKEISFGVSWHAGIETASPDYAYFNY